MNDSWLGTVNNLVQFSQLVSVSSLMGAMIGPKRTLRPSIAEQEFHFAAKSAVRSFLVVFGTWPPWAVKGLVF